MSFAPRRCATCQHGTPEAHRQRCRACLYPDVPLPPCTLCGEAYFVAGYCRRCHPRMQGHPDSCRACHAWGLRRIRGLCNACYQFAQSFPAGICRTCGRELPLREGACRLCRHQAAITERRYGTPMDLSIAACDGHQLFLADIPRPGPLWRKAEAPAPFRPPRFTQPVLFDAPRDMSKARASGLTPLDASYCAHVIAAARRISVEHGWPEWTWTALSWSLNLLTAVHRPDEKIKASSVLTFTNDGEIGHEVGRVLDVLNELGLLHDDRPDVLGAWIDKRLAGVAPAIRREAQAWIDILRHGAPRRPPRKQATIRQKIDYIARFLTDISADHTTLREVTGEEIRDWLRGRPTFHADASAIRDLFKTLTTARVIFGNPARNLHTGSRDRTVPMPLTPTDLRAVGQAAEHDPALKVIVALVGIHALYPKQARELTLDAIDIHRNRLILPGGQRPLDDYTRAAVTGYLRQRRSTWPNTRTAYLLVTQRTAHTGQPVTAVWMNSLFRDLPVTAARLREDRLLEEAAHNGDPLHLSAVFSITPITSLRFVKALYGEASFGVDAT